MSRFYLDVPFAEKDAAKSLGARWDPRRRKWYVADASVLRLQPALQRWLPQPSAPPVPDNPYLATPASPTPAPAASSPMPRPPAPAQPTPYTPAAPAPATPAPASLAPRTHRATATQLAQFVRCEQQAVFDAIYGRTRSSHLRARQAEGAKAHKDYERRVAAGERPRASPCFIATATFGQDAFETWTLRRFRERRLRPHAPGRLVIALYERLSPPLADALSRRPRAARAVRAVLRLFIAVVRD